METKTQNQITKPPVVVVLGHIDHGKTSLLLAIRNLTVPAEKPGGVITQHIGAYQIEKEGKKITFLDTPGHEAFSQMRSRGAKVADIAVLVVAGDEGVKTQTKEAISHIKEADLPFVVAINKIDKPQANPAKVKGELAKENILVESMGGKIPAVEISAKGGKGIDELLDLILLVAEMENLQTNLVSPAKGVVIESYLDALRGPAATLILNQGKLKAGQIIGTHSTFGKIKSLENWQGEPLNEALPSEPVLILGFENIPRVGEEFKTFSSLEGATTNIKIEGPKGLKTAEIKPGQKVLNLILKADVLGSLEAIEQVLESLPQEKVVLNILTAQVGEITETDVKLATHSKAWILGFRVKVNPVASALLEREGGKAMVFEIIYDLVEAVRKNMERILEPAIVRMNLGKMKTLVVFITEKNRQVVGGKVVEGQVKKGALIEISQNGEIKGKGRIINLQKNKKDVDLAKKGEEAGILYEGNIKIEEGDILTIYTEERRKGEL